MGIYVGAEWLLKMVWCDEYSKGNNFWWLNAGIGSAVKMAKLMLEKDMLWSNMAFAYASKFNPMTNIQNSYVKPFDDIRGEF